MKTFEKKAPENVKDELLDSKSETQINQEHQVRSYKRKCQEIFL